MVECSETSLGGLLRYLLILLLSACATSSTEYRQGAPGVPAVRPPAMRPGYGAPMLGQPGVTAPGVPRSPHNRVLPPTKEPGLWAADAPRASGTDDAPTLYGIVLPFPEGATSDEDRAITRACARDLVDVSEGLNFNILVPQNFRPAGVQCLAARLYLACATRMEETYKRERDAFVRMDKGLERRLAATKRRAHEFAKALCSPPVRISTGQDRAYTTVVSSLEKLSAVESLLREMGQ